MSLIGLLCKAPDLFDPFLEPMWPLCQRFSIEVWQEVGVFKVAELPNSSVVNKLVDDEERKEKERL